MFSPCSPHVLTPSPLPPSNFQKLPLMRGPPFPMYCTFVANLVEPGKVLLIEKVRRSLPF